MRQYPWTWQRVARILLGGALGVGVAVLIQPLREDEPLLGLLISAFLAVSAILLLRYLRKHQGMHRTGPRFWLAGFGIVLVISSVVVTVVPIDASDTAHKRSASSDAYPCGSLIAPHEPTIVAARSECSRYHTTAAVLAGILAPLGLGIGVGGTLLLTRRQTRGQSGND